MIDAIKEKMFAKGAALVQHPAVGKMLESEAVGNAIEKAMTVPIKLSGALQSQRERIAALLDLATQEDVDDLKRAVMRMEDLLRDLKRESSDLLRSTEKSGEEKKPVAE
ncbi:MAG: hypothetical protein R6V85_16475 [Polyangia bacterium]